MCPVAVSVEYGRVEGASCCACLKRWSVLNWNTTQKVSTRFSGFRRVVLPFAGSNFEVNGTDGCNDHEWDLVPRSDDRSVVGPDLVRGVAILCNPIRTNNFEGR